MKSVKCKMHVWGMTFILLTCLVNGCGKNSSTDSIKDNPLENSSELPVIEINKEDSTLHEKTTKEKETDKKRNYEYMDITFEEGPFYTEPYLLNPTSDGVEVAWMSEEKGEEHYVLLYEDSSDNRPTRKIAAKTTKLSQMYGGRTKETMDDPKIKRDIFRHCASVDRLLENDGSDNSKISYRVVSDGIASRQYTLSALATKDTPQRILLTSDLQLKTMCAANMQKVMEQAGTIDAIFLAGDLVDVADRAYDWFDAENAFFKVMQGRADSEVNGANYRGGELLQNAPIFPAIGNHDVMGPYSENKTLSEQFNNPYPNNFNTTTYQELFEKEPYYAFSIGNIRVIVLEMARIWRLPQVGVNGKYSEAPGTPESQLGGGQFIFEPIKEGSAQLDFFRKELASEEFQNAEYRVVMYHFDNHSLGANTIPPYTDPVAMRVLDQPTGIELIFYDYPIEEDYIKKYVDPLLEEYQVNLVFTAHSHIWNRFRLGNVNILQSSNVGNSYGGYDETTGGREFVPSAFLNSDPFHPYAGCWNKKNYVLKGDPGGLTAIKPAIAPLPDDHAFLASNSVTAFSILDTGKGVVESYYFDTEKPDSEVVLFDSFSIK